MGKSTSSRTALCAEQALQQLAGTVEQIHSHEPGARAFFLKKCSKERRDEENSPMMHVKCEELT